MSFRKVLEERRSIRKYKPDPIPDELITEILESARIAPSSSNRQPWHFIVVKDANKKKAFGLREWAVEAPAIIVGCVDTAVSPKWHLVDFAIAFEHIILAATNLGLGTCWMGRLENESAKKILNIPENINVVAVTPLGYPDEKPEPKGRKTLSEIVHFETF
ncbi:MAG: nitroreductase family protein [Candidatus Bathyarchaeota archaeon]